MTTVIVLLSNDADFRKRLGAVVRGGIREVIICEDITSAMESLKQQDHSILILHGVSAITTEDETPVLYIEDTDKKSIDGLMEQVRLKEETLDL